ncbi:MAG: ArnT family glycosyltransferase [Candidatus Omnitrophota bacterium]
MANQKILLWLAILFIFSFLLRLFFISLGPYTSDCLYLAIQSEKIVRTHQMHYLQSSGLPLTVVLGASFVWLFQIFSVNAPVFAVNFMSVWFGSMCVVAMFFCVKQLTDIRTALISAVFLTLNPFFIGLSSFGNSHMPAVFFLLTGIYYLLRFPESRRTSHLFFSGLWLGCMGAARIQDLMVMSIPLLYLGLSKVNSIRSDKQTLLKYITVPLFSCLGVILIAYVPKFVIPNLPTGDSSFIGYVQANFTNHIKGLTFTALINIFTDVLTVFSPLEWVLMAGGLVFLIIQIERKKILFLLLWIIIPAVIFSFLSFFVFRLMIISFIPLIIMESYCINILLKTNNRWAKLSIPVILLFVLINLNRYYPMFLFRHQNALLPEFFQWVNVATEENSLIIERDHSIWIYYYAKRKPFGPAVGYSQLTPETLDVFKNDLDNLLRQGIPVYVTKYGLLDRKDLFRKFMVKNYRLEIVGSRMIEDWHLGCLKQVVVQNDLLRITPLTE